VSARILIFPKKAVRTRALRLQEQRKEQKAKALYVQELLKEKKHQEKNQDQRKYVRTARAREDANQRILAYLKTQFRRDLKAAGTYAWRDFALQLWSALHPDRHARPTRPIANIQRYARALLARIEAGTFFPPPQVAQVRRDRARMDRRRKSVTRRIEARRMAEVTAALARGEYPGLG
jgi:hypothetical protein